MWCLSSRDGKKCPEGAPRSFRVNYPFWPTSSILKTQYMPRYALIVAFPDEGTAVRSVFLHEDVEDSGLRTIYPPIILDPLGYSSLDHQYLQQYMYIIYIYIYSYSHKKRTCSVDLCCSLSLYSYECTRTYISRHSYEHRRRIMSGMYIRSIYTTAITRNRNTWSIFTENHIHSQIK